MDEKRGFSLFSPSLLHPKTEITTGIMARESADIMTRFFRERRK
jgi:tRNA(adenine34) deaminase